MSIPGSVTHKAGGRTRKERLAFLVGVSSNELVRLRRAVMYCGCGMLLSVVEVRDGNSLLGYVKYCFGCGRKYYS